MKKISQFAMFAIFALFVFSFASCNKDDEGNEVITVNGEASVSLTFDAEGDSKTVVVKGTKSWTAEAIDWLTVSPKSGAANTGVTVTISAGANEREERAGSVQFTLSSGEYVAVVVNQLEKAAE